MTNLEKAFRKMRADIQLRTGPTTSTSVRRGRSVTRTVSNRDSYSVDVQNGKFIFTLGETGAKVTVQDTDIDDKHILVNVQREVTNERRSWKSGQVVIDKSIINDKWLCGHDERDWFVAAVEGTSIAQAKQNLKPKEIQALEKIIKPKKRNKRKNEVFLRQGEWFFTPAEETDIPSNPITHKDEPISRPGGGKPHIVEEVYRTGGRAVWVRAGLLVPDGEYNNMKPEEQRLCTQRQANANVYGRGYVKHPDHATIQLIGWHRIFMNTEKRDRKGSTMVFLD